MLLIEPIEVFTTLRSTITDDKESLEPLTVDFNAALGGMELEMNRATLMQRKHQRPPYYNTLEAYPVVVK